MNAPIMPELEDHLRSYTPEQLRAYLHAESKMVAAAITDPTNAVEKLKAVHLRLQFLGTDLYGHANVLTQINQDIENWGFIAPVGPAPLYATDYQSSGYLADYEDEFSYTHVYPNRSPGKDSSADDASPQSARDDGENQ